MSKLMIVKLGGSVITDKQSVEPKARLDVIKRLAEETARAYTPKMSLIIVHGAGSYGHQIVKRTGIHNGITTREQVIAFAETQRLQNELDSIVTKEFISRNVPCFPCQASDHVVMDGGRLKSMDLRAIKGLLKTGVVPTFFGVPAYDKTKKCSILSGDQIAPYLATKLRAKIMIHGTNVNGVFTADPNKDPNARHIPEINEGNWHEVRQYLAHSATVDVTGGMLGKVTETYELARAGIESIITDITKPGNLEKALRGEALGTVIR